MVLKERTQIKPENIICGRLKIFFVVQPLSHVRLFGTPQTMVCQIFHHLLEFAQIHVHCVSDVNHLTLCHPLLLLLLLLSNNRRLYKSKNEKKFPSI